MKMDFRPIWVTLAMQETWEFKISQPIEKSNFPLLLVSLFEKNTKELSIFLSFYFRKQGAVAENVVIFNSPVLMDEFSGLVKVKFDLVFFNACLNIYEKENDQMELSFKILPEDALIIIKGPYWPEREMDEI